MKVTHALVVPLASILAATTVAQVQSLTLEQTVLTRRERIHFYGVFPEIVWKPDSSDFVYRGPNSDFGGARRREFGVALTSFPAFGREAGRIVGAEAPLRDGKFLWIEREHDLYFQEQGRPAVRLTDDGEPKSEIEMSPDGRYLAFVRGHDLHTVDTTSGDEVALSTGGSEDHLFGRLDWVYQEEVFERGNFKGYWWSPKGDAVVLYALDQTAVKDFPVIDHVPDPTLLEERSVVAEVDAYPKAGDPNPTVRLGIAKPTGGEIVWVDLSNYDPDILIVRAGWNPDGTKVVFQVQNRIQTWLDLNYADPATGAVTTMFRETSDSWVNILGEPRWLADGSFLWLSERTGFKHIYHCDAAGQVVRALTGGEWVVDEILGVDEAKGEVWFSGNREAAIEVHAYRVPLAGGDLVHLTPDPGSHRVVPSPDFAQFSDVYSSVREVPELRKCAADGEVLEVRMKLRLALDKFGYGFRELHRVPARDGYEMDVAVLRPQPFDENRTYPVFLEVYAGPNAPMVRNEWNLGGESFHQFLAQQGVIVLQVNNRSASGRGQKYTGACYKDLGASELRDLEDAVAWLCAHPWADASRVAISGWSYGGTMAAYALTHSDKFAVGIAGAGVYDWRLYDTIYTERYMDTPQANPEGYVSSSCIAAAADLRGHLLLLHGTMDENVHLQNVMQFAYALQKADRPFDLMVYPKSRHGVVDPDQMLHLRRIVWSTLKEHLRP